MIRAILDGSKTQARYAIKPQPTVQLYSVNGGPEWTYPDPRDPDVPDWGRVRRCPYGADGDRMWVKETWQEVHPLRAGGRYSQEGRAGIPGPPSVNYRVVYRADGDGIPALYHTSGHPYRTLDPNESNLAGIAHEDGWSSSVHMPRWASRITLEITGIRVERLHDITEEGAKAEGIHVATGHMFRPLGSKEPMQLYTHRQAFAALWDELNHKRGYGWESNPFCWVVEFRQI